MSNREGQGSPRRPIELHIDKLVLKGFQPGDRYRIGHAVQSELSRLLTEQGIALGFTQSISIDRLHAGRFSISSRMPTLPQGSQIARAVYGAVERVDNSTNYKGERSQTNGISDISAVIDEYGTTVCE